MSCTNLLNGDATCLPQKRRAGRKKFKETRHPVFRGVRERNGGKWVCEIREPNKKSRIWLGTYPSADLAARAHDVAALALRGDRSALNFPNSAWLAPQAKSTSPKDIRLAALQATKLCKGEENSGEGEQENCTNYDDLKCLENSEVEEDSKVGLFLDEEALFNMPSLIDDMAEGMLLTPPSLKKGIFWDEIDDDYGNTSYIDLDLW